jgi:predicted DNA-binding transcriptional regulator AlpA
MTTTRTGVGEIRSAGLMTIEDVLRELQISRSTLDAWRRSKRFPAFRRLPNGQLRLKRVELDKWLDQRKKAA